MFRRILLILLIITSYIALHNGNLIESEYEQFSPIMQPIQNSIETIQQKYDLIKYRIPIQFNIGSVRTYQLGESNGQHMRPKLNIDGQNLSTVKLHFEFDASQRGESGPTGINGPKGEPGEQGTMGKPGPIGYSGSKPWYMLN
jgi:hypothetical protein